MLVYNEDISHFQLPKGYTFENKLISVAVQEFLSTYLYEPVLDGSQILIMKSELTNLLFKNFKYKFTTIELVYEDRKLSGKIEFEGGLPLDFELKHSQPLIA
jgi:hypothetical protein